MLKNILTLLLCCCIITANSQLKQPAYFIGKIPPFPATVAQHKQTRPSLDLLIKEATAEVQKYTEAEEELMPDESSTTVTTRRFTMKSAAVAQRNNMQQKKQEEELNQMILKSNQYVADFERLQMEYKKEVTQKIAPIDVKLILLIRDQAKNKAEILKVKKERAVAYDVLLKKYLVGPDAKFPFFLNEYLAYTKSTIMPFTDKQEAAKFQTLKLPFTPYGGSIDALKTYMVCQQRAADNFNDQRD